MKNFIIVLICSIAVILIALTYIVFIFYEVVDKIEVDPTITIGQDSIPECQAHVHLSVWNHMNEMGIYHWVVACEKVKMK